MTLLALKQLKPGGEINSRSDSSADIDSLANSILQLGLVQPLSVMKNGEDTYRIIDGNRRYHALRSIFPDDRKVECLVQKHEDETRALEQSVAANIERLPLHPMDQYEAFARIGANGISLEDVAAHFGVTVRHVRQMMALGALCETARVAYRTRQISDRLAKLLTTETEAEQERLLGSGRLEWQIVEELLERRQKGAMKATDKVAQFVGLLPYLHAGGTLVSDLFVDEAKQDWANAELAHRLAFDKVYELRQKALDAGWSFAEKVEGWVGDEYICDEPSGPVDPEAMPDDVHERWVDLRERFAELTAQAEIDGEVTTEYEAVEETLAEIEDEYRSWTPEEKATRGMVIDGRYSITYGCVPRERSEPDRSQTGAEEKPKDEPIIPSGVMMDLEDKLTQAAGVALAEHPAHAIRMMALTLLRNSSHFGLDRDWSLGISTQGHATCDYNTGKVDELIRRIWLRRAKTFEARMACMWKLDDDEVHVILAWFAARSLTKRRPTDEVVLYLDKLGFIDIGKQWQATPETFFNRLNKSQLQRLVKRDAADEVSKTADVMALKKAEAVVLAQRLVGENYLPREIIPKAGKSARARPARPADHPSEGEENEPEENEPADGAEHVEPDGEVHEGT
jgi:ParB family chromosome partitioning protein